jgi:hypothetical protein
MPWIIEVVLENFPGQNLAKYEHNRLERVPQSVSVKSLGSTFPSASECQVGPSLICFEARMENLLEILMGKEVQELKISCMNHVPVRRKGHVQCQSQSPRIYNVPPPTRSGLIEYSGVPKSISRNAFKIHMDLHYLRYLKLFTRNWLTELGLSLS